MGLEVEGRAPPRLGGGRFVVVDTVGDGGTASVYLTWDNERRQWCALKALHHKYLKDDEMRRRFAQEAEALSQLRHENIPALYHHDKDASPPYLVMELARNGSAMDWVKEHGKMPPSMAADVIFQVCQALAEAHAAGIVHRDVKPHNFLLDDHGRCRLTDFGIARLTETTSFTATGSQIGTFSFMAPEQRADTKSVDLRADVYSVGASLYTLLTARTSAELFVADQDDDLLAEVPLAFRRVIARATRYKPDERYASVLELQTDLMNALSRIPPDQAEYPPLVRPREPLPAGPPRLLPPGKRFEDLERSLGLDTNQPTYVPDAKARAAAQEDPRASGSDGNADSPRKKSVPYFMPSRPNPIPGEMDARTTGSRQRPAGLVRPPPAPPSAGASIPSYIADSEVAGLEKAHAVAIESSKRRLESEEAEARMRTATAVAAAEEAPGVERFVVPVIAVGALLFVLVTGLVGYGAWSVTKTKAATAAEAEQLADVLAQDGNVVYDLGGDRRVFEELYLRAVDRKSADHMQSALAFVSQVDALSASQELTVDTEPRVRRLQGARQEYLEALRHWQAASTSVPGRVAVAIGVGSPPP